MSSIHIGSINTGGKLSDFVRGFNRRDVIEGPPDRSDRFDDQPGEHPPGTHCHGV